MTGSVGQYLPVLTENVLHYGAQLNACHLFEELKIVANLNGQNEIGRTSLVVAAVNGSRGFARELVKAGADIGIRDRFGETALDVAVRDEGHWND